MRGTQLQTFAIEGTPTRRGNVLQLNHPPGDQSRVTGGETYTTCFSWSRAGH
jgi:hypothetical protein